MSSWREPRESRPVDDAALPPLELIFELKWKKPGKSSLCTQHEDIIARIEIQDASDPNLDLPSFKSYLSQYLGLSGDVAVSYVDGDGDELPIDSECEFSEALKFARTQAKESKNVLLLIDEVEGTGFSEKSASKRSSLTSNSAGLIVFKPQLLPTTLKNKMPIIPLTALMEYDKKPDGSCTCSTTLSTAAPPAWFTIYMEMFKNEIVQEVSKKVMADVTIAVNNGRSERCPSCSHSTSHCRTPRESNGEDKQHRKKKKRADEPVESSDAFSSSQQADLQLLRKVKKFENRKKNLQKKFEHKLEQLEKMTRNIWETKNHSQNSAAIAKSVEKTCEIPEAGSFIAAGPAVQRDSKKAAVTNITLSNKGRNRMNCSVTGHEMLEKPNCKDLVYESDSDSDNISIISGISDMSDLEHDYNFEIVQTPPCFILDKHLSSCETQNLKLLLNDLDNGTLETPVKESYGAMQEVESDGNNNRDSPSYEVLSGPASSASSIHLVEDYFHTSGAATNLINLNQDDPDTNNGSIFVVDPQGKDSDKNIVDETNDLSEMYLDKRPGGAYAFVNETLPSHATKDTSSHMSKSETNVEQFGEDHCNLNLTMKSSHPSYETKEKVRTDKVETPTMSQSHSTFESQTSDSQGVTQESTHSFSSHTSHGTGSSVYNFTQAQTRATYPVPKYTVFDNNASKGLREKKYTCHENNLGARGCQGKKSEKSSNSQGKYQRVITSEGTACAFTEQPQKTSPKSGTRESSPEFGRAVYDSVHILPETLVSGAVTVASSAYSTARKVIERIRNMQTGELYDNVENGVTISTDVDEYSAVLEEMGFTNIDLNARLLRQFNYDIPRVISELVQ
ncbi:uncharacterized protein LOC105685795 [Athalia rosae]|uniref:uncharacterized protein LOC105685795 n=1 Tax=Athalia rosae TaxID=37344 RepID=UPI0020337AFA|nr:uncharacterized protein LOC105685795 [Athalia rosae]